MAQNNSINKQTEDLIVDKAAGDPFVNFKIATVDKFTIGVDDTDLDKLKITDGGDPSTGNVWVRLNSVGALNVPVEINVGAETPTDTEAQITNQFSADGAQVAIAVRNTSNTAGSHAVMAAHSGGSSSGNALSVYSSNATNHWSVGMRPADDKFYICQSNFLTANAIIAATPAGAITFNAAYTFPPADGSANQVLTTDGAAGVTWDYPGVVQSVSTNTTATVDCSTVLPGDDSIPQNTEGTEVLTLAITPKSATNILEIEFSTYGTVAATRFAQAAMFQDATVNAISATTMHSDSSEAWGNALLRYRMVSGTTSSTTFKVRVGCNAAGSFYINGSSGGRSLGGVASTYLTIKEYKP